MCAVTITVVVTYTRQRFLDVVCRPKQLLRRKIKNNINSKCDAPRDCEDARVRTPYRFPVVVVVVSRALHTRRRGRRVVRTCNTH